MVGILYISDLNGCPFIKRYISALEAVGEDYKIITWNREAKETCVKEQGNLIEFCYYQDTQRSKLAKLWGFVKFAKFLNSEVKKQKFDKLIVLCTLTGFLVAPKLLKAYKGKYIFDIRDISYENIGLFNKLEKKIIDNSCFTAYSSYGFLELLPKSDKLCFCPNIIKSEVESAKQVLPTFTKKQYGEKLNFVYVGAVRQYDNVRNIVDAFGNHPKFELYYHGSGGDGYADVAAYADQKGYTNVHFTGRYQNSEKVGLLKPADLLNNFYAATKDMKYANTNKYLDSVVWHIPLVCNSQTHDGELCVKEGVGIAYNGELNADKLYEDYFKINEVNFNSACVDSLNDKLNSEAIIQSKTQEFLNI